MKNTFFTLLLYFIGSIVFSKLSAQDYTISGRVIEASNGEDVFGAIISAQGTNLGASSNEYGIYSLTLPKGKYTIIFFYPGFEEERIEINLNEDKVINYEFKEFSQELDETVVSASAQERRVENKKISAIKLDIKDIENVPIIFGEPDILKTVTLLPGVISAGEGSSGFSVRGGSQDQNLILLDEATVYNASHLLGFFSVFNSDAIKDLELYKGGIPAKFGGRLSSLLDVRMRDGNKKEFAGKGGIGIISSRLTLEGPLKKEKSSFLVSGRRTYGDLFLPLANNEDAKNSKLYFYDLNLKANYSFSDKDRIYLSGYFGRDVFGFANLFGLNWGNATATLRWNHIYNKKLFSNISLIYSDFNFGTEFTFAENAQFGIDQGFKDYSLKADYTYFYNPNNKFLFGAQSIYHDFTPGIFKPLNEKTENNFSTVKLSKRYALENAVYLEHLYKKGSRFNIRYGIRLSNFNNMGNASGVVEYDFAYTEKGLPIVTNTFEYNKVKIYNSYFGIEPRLAANYNLSETEALKFSYNRTYQYLQQASNSNSTLPTDQWFPSSITVEPQYADQVALGFFKNLDKLGLETSAEAYYKHMYNQIDYRNGASLTFNEELEGELVFGQGRAYGLELFVKKYKGKTTGWISYTLAKSERQIFEVMGNDWYRANLDRRHNLNIVVSHKINEQFVVSGNFVFSSGTPFTVPISRFLYKGEYYPYFGERNNFQLPDYHRADIGLTYYPKKRNEKKIKGSWNFSVYNLYARENAFAIIYEDVLITLPDGFEINTGRQKAFQIALFKIIPSITWNFEF